MRRSTFLLFITTALAIAATVHGTSGETLTESPHSAALAVVFKTQAAKIRDVDPGDWGLDTKERVWSVRRPIAPGVIDTTHFFKFTYKIDGGLAASWVVDTRKGTAIAEQ